MSASIEVIVDGSQLTTYLADRTTGQLIIPVGVSGSSLSLSCRRSTNSFPSFHHGGSVPRLCDPICEYDNDGAESREIQSLRSSMCATICNRAFVVSVIIGTKLTVDAYRRTLDILNRGFGGYNTRWYVLPLLLTT